jgi:hypothetical protein
MLAILAAIAFAIALIFHLAGGSVTQYVLTAELAGLICVALHLAGFGDYVTGRFRRPPPAA